MIRFKSFVYIFGKKYIEILEFLSYCDILANHV